MFLEDLAEPTLLVIYPGRFQPFHKGHKAVYDWLTGKFGSNNVYIATSNKVEGDRSPFNFAEKSYFMQLTGVPVNRIVQASQPYQITSIQNDGHLNISNPENTVVIFAVSEKDMAEDPRFSSWTKKDGSPAYFQPLKDIKQTESMNQHGYILTVPTFDFDVAGDPMQSASELRVEYRNADTKKRQLIVKDLFGRYTPEAEQIMTSKLAPAAPATEPKLTKQAKLQKVAKPKAEPIAESMFFQGYQVDIDPVRKELVVSRGGQVLHRENTRLVGRPANAATVKARLSAIIDKLEDDKYPDDLEMREGWFSKAKPGVDDTGRELMKQDRQAHPDLDDYSWQIGWIYAEGNKDVKAAYSDAYWNSPTLPSPPEARSFKLGFDARKNQAVAEADETSWTANSAQFRKEEDLSWTFKIAIEPNADENRGRGRREVTKLVSAQSVDAAKKKIREYFLRNGWEVVGIEQVVPEMDKSQPSQERHGDYPLGAKGTTVKPVKAKKVVKDLAKDFNRAFAKEKPVKEQGVAEGDTDTYNIIRTNGHGKKDVFASNYSLEQAKDELAKCLAHPLHTKYGHKFEIVKRNNPSVAEGWKAPVAALATVGALAGGVAANPDLEIDGKRYQKTTQHALSNAPADAQTVTKDGKTYKVWSVPRTKGGVTDVYAEVKPVNEFAPGNGEDNSDDLTDEAFKDGQRLGFSLVDGATRSQGFEASQYLDRYLVPFAYGWNAGRKAKIAQARRDGVELAMKKDGSLARGQVNEFAPGGADIVPPPPKAKGKDPFEPDDRSQLLRRIKQLRDQRIPVDSYVAGARGHIDSVTDDLFGFRGRKFGKKSPGGFLRPMTADDDSQLVLKQVGPVGGPQHYQLWNKELAEDAGGVGVIANKKQANDPRYKTSLTKDVRPGAIKKSLRAFNLAEHATKKLVEAGHSVKGLTEQQVISAYKNLPEVQAVFENLSKQSGIK